MSGQQGAHWWTKAQAAKAIGVSVKTIERKTVGVETRSNRRPGKKPELQLKAADVRVRFETVRRPQVIEPGAAPPRASLAAVFPKPLSGPGAAAPAGSDAERALVRARSMNAQHDVGAALVRLAESATRKQAAPWLRLDEAAEYSGLSKTRIRRLCKSGVLLSIRDGARKVQRQSLDDYAGGDE